MIEQRHGAGVWFVPADGPELATEQDAVDLVGATYGLAAEVIVVPVERFADRFFDMHAKLIGHFFSKIVQYGFRLVLLGDVRAHIEASDAFRDVVRESNRGRSVWFVADLAELDARLAAVG
ncbi:DUF4180 domain-containing protein [Amycolatopsis sp. OK19-0408]|uniref:DUF4180 domain-containing protein n=1 Tax=Amycolatopsis iheyensis TaxID=2945988 RepID=A0A9X2NF43_9PSEU|nr:DUF4180 domain-containing protein [Amycolatopsis iheyensis]MCR6483435.1 DUF4180 domain-containing protein [Amycolatopsis iheyensis]